MKITVDVDCTPIEARAFMGLPDLTPLHDIYMEQIKKALSEGVSPDMVETMMRNWGPFGEAGLGVWRQMFDPMRVSSGEK